MNKTWKRALGLVATMGGGLALSLSSRAQQTPCQGSTGPDVIVGAITGPFNYAATGTVEALSLGTTSCNQGNATLGWHANTNQHPVIGGELYRFKTVNGAGHFDQVGLSWLKHGFFAESQTLCCPNCQPTDGTVLGVGCSDPYNAERNGAQSLLGPRYQVNPHTGFFTYPPPVPSGGNTGRLQVEISELEVSSPGGTRYFGNCQYVTPDDAAANNNNNNVSYREVTVSGSGSTWNFGLSGSTVRETPAIKAWPTCEAGVTVNDIQLPSEGMLMLGFKTTDLGGGQFHYEYDEKQRLIWFSEKPTATGVTIRRILYSYDGNNRLVGRTAQAAEVTSLTAPLATLQWLTETRAGMHFPSHRAPPGRKPG
jgi:hypothetical protein